MGRGRSSTLAMGTPAPSGPTDGGSPSLKHLWPFICLFTALSPPVGTTALNAVHLKVLIWQQALLPLLGPSLLSLSQTFSTYLVPLS